MKNTEIAFILDRSGSMRAMTNAAISGFNEFLKAQQATVDDDGALLPATFRESMEETLKKSRKEKK